MDSRQPAPLPVNPVGDLLRLAQSPRDEPADLGFDAGISIKHLSYVETGKAAAAAISCCNWRPRSVCRCATATRCWRRAEMFMPADDGSEALLAKLAH
jgi:hypothetical protein